MVESIFGSGMRMGLGLGRLILSSNVIIYKSVWLWIVYRDLGFLFI